MQSDQKKNVKETTKEGKFLFKEQLPEEILKDLTPELRRQYFLWDEIAKKEIQLYPRMILPLIEEVFHQSYPKNVEIELLSTEYAVRRFCKDGGKLLQSVYSDLLLRVGTDRYHLECQMEEDRNMVLRMLEYDIHIALAHGVDTQERSRKGDLKLTMPRSVILYLDHSGKTPDYETCTLCFADGTSHLYKVPVVKVQEYSIQAVKEKHLNMLIPFLPIRFRRAVKSTSLEKREQAKKNLTELVAECIMVLKQEKENGTLIENERNDIAEFLRCACDQLYGGDPEMIVELHGIVEPAIKLRREIIQELQGSIADLQEDKENVISRLIQKSQTEGKSIKEVQEFLQEIFSLSEEEAKKKVGLYWKS